MISRPTLWHAVRQLRGCPFNQARSYWTRRHLPALSLARGMFEQMEENMRQMQRQMDSLPFRVWPEVEGVKAEAVKESQITQNQDGSKQVRLEFQIQDFKPEEVTVKFDRLDNSLSVSAHHESLQEGHHVTRRFSKLIRLPAEIESESLTSSLKDGVLAIQAPLADQQKNNSRIVDIPIEKIG